MTTHETSDDARHLGEERERGRAEGRAEARAAEPPPEHPSERRPEHRAGHRADGRAAGLAEDRATASREVVARQREAFGGMKLGAAFFGFLTAAGVAVLLTALLVATGAAVGIGVDTEVASDDVSTIGVWGAVVVAVLVFVAYYCGGYVAGRMARFDGGKQGFAVWLWAIVVAVIVAVLAALAGQEYNLFAQVNLFPRIPVAEGDLTTAGVAAALGAVVVALLGAVLGGLLGVRFHRRVDRAGFDV